jgi:two-component system chemotaxis sensor kinase CheA
MAQKHILIVDDETTFRSMLKKLLESAGYRVSEAKNALAVFGVGAYDLMVLDIQMPGIDGHKILASLKEDKAHPAPIIVLTGLADPAHREQALGEGADAFMTKPLSKELFLAKVTELLSRTPTS